MTYNKKIKIIISIITIIIILIIESPISYMMSDVESTGIKQQTSIDDIVGGAEKFEEAGQSLNKDTIAGGISVDDGDIQNVSSLVYNTIFIVGIVIVVVVGLVIGIQFMTGSVEQKAEVKQTLIPYVVGCIIIFGAFAIWRIVVNLLNQTQ